MLPEKVKIPEFDFLKIYTEKYEIQSVNIHSDWRNVFP